MAVSNDPPESDPTTVAALRSWLLDRVGDDNDIVVDDLQADLAAGWDEKEEAGVGKSPPIDGSEAYAKSIAIKREVEELKAKRTFSGLGDADKRKKISDGERDAYFVGQTDDQGRPHGQGGLQYENQDVFRGK